MPSGVSPSLAWSAATSTPLVWIPLAALPALLAALRLADGGSPCAPWQYVEAQPVRGHVIAGALGRGVAWATRTPVLAEEACAALPGFAAGLEA